MPWAVYVGFIYAQVVLGTLSRKRGLGEPQLVSHSTQAVGGLADVPAGAGTLQALDRCLEHLIG
jgi:hypothetical protein